MAKFAKLESVQSLKIEFKKVFLSLTRKHSYSEVWADFCSVVGITAHQSAYMSPAYEEAYAQGLISSEHFESLQNSTMPRDKRWEALEQRYMAYVPKYESEGMSTFARLYAITSMAIEGHRVDFLGSLYQEMDLSGAEQRGKRGEFFTPTAVADMMAGIQMRNIQGILDNRGFVTLQEPACGAGGMIISFANQMEQAGYDPRQVLYVEAVDVNQTFFNMCYIQLSLLDIPARVWCGNSLSLEFTEVRETPQLMLSRHFWNKDPVFLMRKFLLEMEQSEDKGESSLEGAPEAAAGPKVELESDMPVPMQPQPEVESFEIGSDGQLRLF